MQSHFYLFGISFCCNEISYFVELDKATVGSDDGAIFLAIDILPH